MKAKFVRIQRGPEFKNREYTSVKAAEHMIQAGTCLGYSPVTLKTIKAERLFEYREEHYFRHVAEAEFVARYDGRRFQAKVIDGGNRTEMLVQITGAEELHLQTIYACNIAGKRTWYPETACVFYNTGDVVEVEIMVTHGFERLIVGITPGILDEERWNRIKDQSLAFRCDENGKATTGLFK